MPAFLEMVLPMPFRARVRSLNHLLMIWIDFIWSGKIVFTFWTVDHGVFALLLSSCLLFRAGHVQTEIVPLEAAIVD